MNADQASKNFNDSKLRQLKKVDQSLKGSIDAKIVELVNYINNLDSFYTTSSCSGRVVVFTNRSNYDKKSKGCDWIYTSHDVADHKSILRSLKKHNGTTTLKFEPFILHIRCATVQDAQTLHVISTEAGFRNSGLTISKAGKITLAVRSTLSLEVPFSDEGNILVSDEYVEYVVQKANDKMRQNWARTNWFFHLMQTKLGTKEALPDLEKEIEGAVNNESSSSINQELLYDDTSTVAEAMNNLTLEILN